MKTQKHPSDDSMNRNERLNYTLYVLGKGISLFGSAIYTFAIGLYVLKQTGSALNFSITLMLGTLPMILFGPIAGILTDRFDKKKLVVGSDWTNGLLFLSLYFYASHLGLTLPIIYATTVLLTLSSTLFGIAIESLKPVLVSERHLLRINAQSKMIDSLSSIMGPLIGGVVYAIWPIELFLLINAISFLFSGATECFFKPLSGASANSRPEISMKKSLSGAIRYIRGDDKLKEFIGIFVFLNFFLGFSLEVPLPYMVTTVLGLPDGIYGMINGAFPVGMIVGAIWVERLMKRFEYRMILLVTVPIMGLASVVLGATLLIPIVYKTTVAVSSLYIFLMLIFGITIALIDVPILYLLQKHVPEALRGRVFSLVFSAVKIVLPVSLLLAGSLIQLIPVYWMPILGGVGALVFGFTKNASKKSNA